MDPLDFLDVARSLTGSDEESGWRTSVGRSYYAVFLHLCLNLAPIKRLPGTGEDHDAVVQYLITANNRDLYSVGQSLNDLRTSRRQADYDMAVAVAQEQSQLALLKASKAVEKFGTVNEGALKAAISALPTYRSKRDAENR